MHKTQYKSLSLLAHWPGLIIMIYLLTPTDHVPLARMREPQDYFKQLETESLDHSMLPSSVIPHYS